MVDLGSFGREGIYRNGTFIPSDVIGPNGESLLTQEFRTGFEGNLIKDTANKGTRRVPQEGRCYKGNGTDEYVSFPDNAAYDITTTLSVSVWAKNDSATLSSTEALVNKYDSANDKRQWTILVNSDEELQVNIGNSGGTGAAGVACDNAADIDSVNHYCFTFDNGTVKIYINGIEQSTTTTGTLPSTLVDADPDLLIGAGGDTGSAGTHWDGDIWDARVYNDVLTHDEVTWLASNGVTGTDPGMDNCVLFAKCDEQSGTISYDSSATANHGTITKATDAFHGTQSVYSFQNQVGFSGGLSFLASSSQYVQVKHSNDFNFGTGAFTVSCFVNLLASTSSVEIATKAEVGSPFAGWSIRYSSGNFQFLAYDNGGSPVQGAFTPANQWVHVIGTRGSDGTIELYLDGILADSDTGSTYNVDNTVPLNIAYDTNNWVGGYLTGHLKGFKVFNKKVSADEALYLASNGATGTDPGAAICDLPFNEMTGTSAYDRSGNGNNGLLVNSPQWHAIPRDESDIANDVAGGALDFTGKCPQDGLLIDSACGHFNGTDEVAGATLTDDTVTNGAFTWEGWISADTIVGYDTIISVDGAQLGLYLKAGEVNLWNGGDNLFDTTLSADTEYHIAVTRDDSNLVTCYINGVAEATTHTITTDRTGTPVLRFGNDGQATTWFDGKIFGWGLYSSALSASEVLYRATNGRQGTAPTATPVVAYDFAEGSGAIAFSKGTNANHLAITSSALSTFWGSTQDSHHGNIKDGFDAGYYFDAGSVIYPDNAGLNPGTGSMSMFVRFCSEITSGTGFVIGKSSSSSSPNDPGYRIYVTASGQTAVFLIADGTTRAFTTATIERRKVTSIGISYAAGTNSWALYKDGVLVNTGVSDGPLSAIGDIDNSEPFTIGRDSSGGTTFDGSVFEAKFYRQRVLTADQQLALHNGEDIGDTGLELDADLAALEADKVPDKSGNQPAGTMAGGTIPVPIRVPAEVGTMPTLTNPPTTGHNKAETEFNCNPYSTPELANVYNGYASFDGSGDYITCADTGVSALINRVTLDFWRATDITSATTSQWLVTFYDASVNYIGIGLGGATAALTGETVTVLSTGAARSGTSAVIQKGWNQLEIRWNASIDNYDIYVNGYKYNDLIAAFAGSKMDARRITFGAYLDGASNFFNGRIKNVKIYGTSDELIRYYPLASDTLDYSGNNHHGTLVNATQPKYTVPTDLGFQESLGENRNHLKRTQLEGYGKFNGTDANVNIPNVFQAASGTAVVDFLRSTVNATIKTVLDIGNTGGGGLMIFSDTSGGARVQYGTASGIDNASLTVTNNVWTRVIVTWNGSDLSVYQDGSLVASINNATLGDIGSTDQNIGTQSANASRRHDGYIANVYAYDRAKDAAWVTANGTVHQEITDKEGLLANWPLKKDCKDYSGRYYDGTNVNVTFGGADTEDRFLLYKEGLEYNSKLPALDTYLKDPREVRFLPEAVTDGDGVVLTDNYGNIIEA